MQDDNFPVVQAHYLGKRDEILEAAHAYLAGCRQVGTEPVACTSLPQSLADSGSMCHDGTFAAVSEAAGVPDACKADGKGGNTKSSQDVAGTPGIAIAKNTAGGCGNLTSEGFRIMLAQMLPRMESVLMAL